MTANNLVPFSCFCLYLLKLKTPCFIERQNLGAGKQLDSCANPAGGLRYIIISSSSQRTRPGVDEQMMI
jgi:hypothetical protein